MDVDEYRRRGKEMVDYIADYLQTIRLRNVFPDVQPGYMQDLIPQEAPIDGENWEDIFKDIERVIMPGITHWQSPHMHAYFPALNSCPSLLGDMLADAIGCLGFTWASSPACTELEVIVMDWLAKAIGLPACFLHNSPGSRGGGVLQGTASEATLIAMLAARTDAIARIKEDCGNPQEFDEGAVISRLVVYCSDQAHSSVEKACLIAMVKIHTIPSDANLSLRGDALQKAIDEDKQKGLVPFYLCATLGTTGACAFDDMAELGPICEKEKIWMHIDAAYAGTAFLCPEYRGYLKGVEYAGSFAFNPSKWLMVHFDCTAMWVKNSASLHRTFNVNPLYLKHDKTGLAIDYMHWQIPLSRRFRALKLWFVIRSFGIKGLQSHVRKGIRLAKLFEGLVRREPGFEVAAERILGLVVFRLNGPNELNEHLLSALNHTGKIYVVPASLKGKYVIRFTVTSRSTTEDDIRLDWNLIRQKARDVRVKFAECGIGQPMENGHSVTRNQHDDDDDDDCGEGHHGGMPNASDATVRKYDIVTKNDDVNVRASFQKEQDENSPSLDFFVNSDYFVENGDKGEFGSVVKYRKCDRNGKAIRDPSLELDDTEGATGCLGKGADKPALGYCGVLKICQHVNIMEEKQNEKLGGVYVRANCCECNTNVLSGKEKKRLTKEASLNGQRK
ncbi:histidine decarboxylase [Saccoglossus kowalevskii]|uniref:Histidine decarboxylase n=1 Tax=Saccoglossus kowalevskii TaxID=10224 RepID=D1LX45_SACKO|nr:histidine decarboxylase [Saccoglossus kowalevskii]ACY92551.1 histidine decarboxylase [Saccoglossus kowalevskii]